ncbi:MAG TPA: chemotaxis protein CheB [Nocardioides sp.]|nr:chemotaxis protein CheB [Nocardioides sp.]
MSGIDTDARGLDAGSAARYDVVALVTSAGGLEALSSVLGALPADLPSAVVVQQHLSTHASRLVELLARRTSLAVRWADDGDRLAPAVVLVARAGHRVEVLPDGTVTSILNRERALSRPHDALLASLAQSYGDRGLAVVLTGMGRDGTTGATAVRSAGGTVLAQSPESSEHPSMPEAATDAGAVDLVLPLAEMGRVLADVVVGGQLPVGAEERRSAAALFAGDDEVSGLYRSLDWRSTPLGPVTQWPEELRTLVAAALETPHGVCVLWGSELLQLYNQAFRVIMGDKHPAGLGAPSRECWPEVWHRNESVLAGALAGRSHRVEDALYPIGRNGRLEDAWFDLSYSPVRLADGQVAGVMVTVIETTRQVLARRRLATLNRLARQSSADHRHAALRGALRAVVGEDVTYAIGWTVDNAGRRAHLVDAVGVAAGEPMAPNVVTLTGHDNAWPLGPALGDGASHLLEDLPRRFGDRSVGTPAAAPGSALVVPLPGGGADPYGVMVLGISPRLPLDQEYRDFLDLLGREIDAAVTRAGTREHEREQMARLAELDRAKTEFFSNVSHEFQTPLTLMIGPLEETLRRADELPPAAVDDLELVHRNALRLQRLVGTLLDFSQTGRLKARPEPTDLAALTTEVVETFRQAADAMGVGLEARIEDLGHPVWVDPGMWEEVVANLLSNALKFTWTGTITVCLRAQTKHAELTVSDTGVGIPDSEQSSVFKRFHQVQGTRGRTREGSGTGLALVNELVRLHHGRVRLGSQEGRGTTVTVWVPLGSRPEREEPPSPAGSPARSAVALAAEVAGWGSDRPATDEPWAHEGRPGVPARSAPAGARLLVVDDSADMRAYLTRLLGASWEVEQARNGAEALERLGDPGAELPDLVVSDVVMPELDGFDLVRRIRSDPHLAAVPVILVTARAEEQTAIEGLRVGADDYVVKPFSARELVARVEAQLELSSLRRQDERRFRALIDASFDVVYRMSADWTRMEHLIGRGFIADTTDPSSNWLDTYIDEADRPEVLAAIDHAIRTRTAFELEHRVRRADGTPGRTLSRATPLLDDDGEVVEWIGTAVDLGDA